MSEPAALNCRKLPGAPLKSFDCFAATCHVALPGVACVAVHSVVLVKGTSALTDAPAVSECALESERNSRMPALSTTAVQPVRLTLVAAVPGVRLTPAGGVKFADPTVCEACGSFVSVNVMLLELPSV